MVLARIQKERRISQLGKQEVEQYILKHPRNFVDRMQDKKKTGVFTGSYAINR